jgi:1,4-dihydroxy-6-naphthoate synthase
MPYVRQYAQTMEEEVMRAHIQLYVNDFSLQLGSAGRQAVEQLLRMGKERGLLPAYRKDFFIN